MTTHVVVASGSLAVIAVFGDDDDKVGAAAVVVFDAPSLLNVDISSGVGPRNMSWYMRRRAIARSGPRAEEKEKRGKSIKWTLPLLPKLAAQKLQFVNDTSRFSSSTAMVLPAAGMTQQIQELMDRSPLKGCS